MQQNSERPAGLPVIPVRELIVFPGVVSPLFISRPRSIRAVEEAAEKDRIVFIAAEKKPYMEILRPENIYEVGTVCQILQNVRLPDGTLKVIVEGSKRAKAISYKNGPSYLSAEALPLESEFPTGSKKTVALSRSILNAFEINISLDSKLPSDIKRSVSDIDDSEILCDVITSHSNIAVEKKQLILETVSVEKRMALLLKLLIEENELLAIEQDIDQKVHAAIDKDQHNYYLREQLRVISDELGEDSPQNDTDELIAQANEADLPEAVMKRVTKEINRFSKLPPASPEAAVARTYIETLCEMPWNKETEDNLDIKHAAQVLEKDHYGLADVKQRILEFLAVKKLAGDNMRAQIICFAGPPGVGKTSLGKSIAEATGRKFINISLGGMHDEAEIRGHRRTYVGALPGRVIQKIRQCGSRNPLILMDEIDKLGSDYKGDPSSALLEVLDPEQNSHFNDNYLELPFDLSRVMFITTANTISTIPRPLLDRMEIIQLPGYVMEEKLQIAKKHLIPRIIEEHGIKKENLKLSETAIKYIIASYTMEAGVRNLDRQLSKVARRIAADKVSGKAISGRSIPKEKISEYLGTPKLYNTKLPKENEVGTAAGLAWTEAGGDVLVIEAAVMPGTGKINCTGNLGEIMQESATIALAYVRAEAENLGLSAYEWNKKDIHIHVPAGAVPKDGPSAGITLALAIISALTERAVNISYAMTGELTLRGNVLPIGGIREKILAAKRIGITEIILPEANRPDISELNNWVLEGMNLHFVSRIETVFELALMKGE